MTVTLFVIGSVIFLGAMLDSSLGQLRNKVDINVYFVTDADEAKILDLKSQIEQLPETASVEYVSREQALENFRKRHEDDHLTIQALDELDENPLGALLNIRAKETSQYESIASFLDGDNVLGNDGQADIIDTVNYFQNRVAIEKLTQIINSAERLGLIATFVLIIISIMITFNTIRLAIYTSREEISVMQLVGASQTYARGPFIVEGILYGVASAILTLVLFYPLTFWLGPFTADFFGDINIFEYFIGNFGQLFSVILLSGIFLGAISSYLAVRRYLKV
jgi:cell division transport system permease protein